MNREDCEKLLDAFEQIVVIAERAGKDVAVDANEAHDNLRDVIVGIMAGVKKPVYRDGGIAAPGTLRRDGSHTTIPTPLTKPVITCDGKGELSAAK